MDPHGHPVGVAVIGEGYSGVRGHGKLTAVENEVAYFALAVRAIGADV